MYDLPIPPRSMGVINIIIVPWKIWIVATCMNEGSVHARVIIFLGRESSARCGVEHHQDCRQEGLEFHVDVMRVSSYANLDYYVCAMQQVHPKLGGNNHFSKTTRGYGKPVLRALRRILGNSTNGINTCNRGRR